MYNIFMINKEKGQVDSIVTYAPDRERIERLSLMLSLNKSAVIRMAVRELEIKMNRESRAQADRIVTVLKKRSNKK